MINFDVNIRDLLNDTVAEHGALTAFTLKTAPDTYRDISYIRFLQEAKCLGTAMMKRGMAGERIAFIGKNSYNWFLVNTAVQLIAGVGVPLDKEIKSEELQSCLERAKVKYLFHDKKEQEMVDDVLASGKTVVQESFALYTGSEKTSVDDLLAEGKEYLDEGDYSIDEVEIDNDGLAWLLFTSGTTSQSKIVMLSQKNVASITYSMLSVEPINETMTNIALLPYHHTFGSTGQWVMLKAGARTVYCDGLKYIQKNLIEYGVSLFVGVPLIVETMYKKIIKTAEKQGALGKLKTFSRIGRTLNKAHIDVRRLMFKGVLAAFGGKLEMFIVGGAPASKEMLQGFTDLGMLAVQGYGLTETSPTLTAEYPGAIRIGSIGKPMPGVELRIANPDENGIGELQAKGPNIMLGYYENEEANKAVFTEDGWFRTGDLGYVDKDGFYYLTGREKNVIVLKNGKNVFPEELEAELAKLPYNKEAIVVGVPNDGDEQDLVVTLKLVYDPEETEGKSYEEICQMVDEDVDKLNAKLPSYKHIKRIIVTDREMIKTTTAKVKRNEELKVIIKQLNEEA